MSIKTLALLVVLGMVIALYFWLGSGALWTGDQLGASVPNESGGVRPSPSADAAGRNNPARQAGSTSPSRSVAEAGQDASARSNIPPLVLVTPGSIIPENVVSASGQGFQPGEQVDLAVQGTEEVASAAALADKDGNFYGVSVTVTVGTPLGDYSVAARGKESGRQAKTALHVAGTAPYANPSTYSGKGATAVSFEGGGFQPQEIVDVHFDSLAVDPLQSVIASAEGTVSMSATVPLADPGDHAFVMVGRTGNTPLRIPFSVVSFNPWINPSNYSPQPQQLLGFAGHDFAPGELVRIYRGKPGETPVATATAGADGEFQLADAYELPVDSVGKNVFMAVGQHTRQPVALTVDVLPFSPGAELAVYAGRVGTAVSFKGQGYARNETLTAYLGSSNGGREVSKFQTSADGSFEGTGIFSIPTDTPSGSATITLVGERSKAPIELSFEVLPITPWVGLTSYSGPMGTTLSFEGHDFLPGENVSIHLGDRQSPTLASVKADDSGGFSGGGRYTVPDDAQGKITFTAVGETSKAEVTAAFVVIEGGDAADNSAGGDATPVPAGGDAGDNSAGGDATPVPAGGDAGDNSGGGDATPSPASEGGTVR